VLALKVLSYDLDVPAAKLKQAYGEAACSILDFLADRALSACNFAFQVPQACVSKESPEPNLYF
jgi:hypothetical protein